MIEVRCTVSSLLFYLVIVIDFSDGARILASVFTPSYSHQIAFRPLWKELDKRGHQITLITTDPMNDPSLKNIKEIDVHMSYDIMESYKHNELLSDIQNPLEVRSKYLQALHDTSMAQLEHPDVQRLIRNQSETFDLLMVEIVHPTHVGFLERWKVPIIGLLSLDAPSHIHEIMGNSIHPAINPDTMLPFAPPLNFWERLGSFLSLLFFQVDGYWSFLPWEDETVRKVFGKSSRPLQDLLQDLDMIFINVNPILHHIRAVTPNTIMFGGAVHLTPPKTLPNDLQEFLDNAAEGVIYMSLGSNVKSSAIREDLKITILQTFASIPYKVLWKFEDVELKNKSDNLMIRKWLPQTDILRHPNVKLFITQCGLQSMEEAIMSNVPMIGLPFFGDQFVNALKIEQKKFGLKLDHTKINEDIFREAIEEVIQNREYKENIIEVADLLTDVDMTGLEKLVWWTEYVIRNDGAKLFRNPVLQIPYYQYYLLDVIAFTSVVLFLIIFGTIKISLYFFYKFLRK